MPCFIYYQSHDSCKLINLCRSRPVFLKLTQLQVRRSPPSLNYTKTSGIDDVSRLTWTVAKRNSCEESGHSPSSEKNSLAISVQFSKDTVEDMLNDHGFCFSKSSPHNCYMNTKRTT